MDGIKTFIFWEFKRGSWQYDIVVIGILAFLFLTPRPCFKDQPRENQIEMLSAKPGVYLLDPRLMRDVPGKQSALKVSIILPLRGKPITSCTAARVPSTKGFPVRTSDERMMWRYVPTSNPSLHNNRFALAAPAAPKMHRWRSQTKNSAHSLARAFSEFL